MPVCPFGARNWGRTTSLTYFCFAEKLPCYDLVLLDEGYGKQLLSRWESSIRGSASL